MKARLPCGVRQIAMIFSLAGPEVAPRRIVLFGEKIGDKVSPVLSPLAGAPGLKAAWQDRQTVLYPSLCPQNKP